MNIEEFSKRTGFYPSLELYAVIEEAYMHQPKDKDAFCKVYLHNSEGLAEAIQREATIRHLQEVDALVSENKRLKKKVDELLQKLEKEQERKPFESKHNVTQAMYKDLEDVVSRGVAPYMTDEEAIKWIADEFDFDPAKIKIVHWVDKSEINRHNQLRRTKDKISRRPIYFATDYHYIRFNTSRQYEVYNGELRPFYD